MLLNSCKDIGVVVNIGTIKYVVLWNHRNVMANEHYHGRLANN